jgi:hypothetical protein
MKNHNSNIMVILLLGVRVCPAVSNVILNERMKVTMNWFDNFGTFLPDLLVALVILVVGWLIAFIVSKLVEGILHRTDLDNRLSRSLKGGQPERLPIERWIALAVFWLIMLFVIVAFLNRLDLGTVSTPLNNMLDRFLAFLPNLVGALVLIIIAWVIATVLRLVITRVVGASGLARRITTNADIPTDERASSNIGETIGNVVYWLVFLLFLPAILDALDLQGILAPVQAMVNDILGILPNILGAALILVAGWLVARIIRQIVTNLLAGMGIDRIGRSTATTTAGAADTGVRLSNVIGMIVFVLILIPIIIAALNVLDIPAIANPAANMLTNFLNALPNIFAAFLLLAIAYFVARIIGQFIANLLASMGFNRWFSWLSLPETASFRRPAPGVTVSTEPRVEPVGGEMVTTRTSPADIVGYIIMVAIILFAAMEAANLLGFDALATLISAFIVQAVNILFGLVIFAFGLFLANQAFRLVRDMNTPNSLVLATAARYAIIFFAAALALREMGIAASIVNLAFGLLLGAVAVALALAFGLGGREFAARTLENWRKEGLPLPVSSEDPKGPFSGGPRSSGTDPIRPSGGMPGSEPPIPSTGGSMTQDEIDSQYDEPTPFDRSGDEDDLPGTDRFPGEDPGQL